MKSEKTRRIVLLILGILITLTLITGVSYARFNNNLAGEKIQSINNGCLEVKMTDAGSITLDNAVPVSDEDGLKGAPYEFTIKNTCTIDAHYEITLNVMDPSNMDNVDKVKVALIGDGIVDPTIIGKLPTTKLLDDKTLGINATYKLAEATLSVGETKTFKLNQWIDYNTEEFTGDFVTKIIVNSTSENIE